MAAVPDAYRVEDNGLLLGVYRRLLWDRLLVRIPAAVHPNALTIAGQLFAVVGALVCAAARAHGPLLYILSAVCLLSCLTLDNLDGAHARRTKQTSALGELLDHGLDGISSGSVLVVTCLVLHLDALMTVVVCALGALVFASLFWEQLRTGLLTIPKVSPTEGMSLLAAWEIVAGLFGDPWWLRFSLERLTAGTVAVFAFVLVHIVAVVPPFLRAAKLNVRGWELAPLFVLTALQLGFALLGAHGLVPAVTVGLVAANLTCRMIVLRHRGQSGPLIPPALYVASAPLVGLLLFPRVWTPTGWALASLAIVLADYARTLWGGASRLLRPARALPC